MMSTTSATTSARSERRKEIARPNTGTRHESDLRESDSREWIEEREFATDEGNQALQRHELSSMDSIASLGGSDQGVVEHSPQGRYVRFNIRLDSNPHKEVWKAYDTSEGVEVAWNTLCLEHMPRADKKRILSEINILEKLDHPNIITFYTSWYNREQKQIVFITELMNVGSLMDFVKPIPVLRWKIVKKWAKQILEGLAFLHSQSPPIIHRNINCNNIFIIANTGELKIGDLGLSIVCQHAENDCVGTAPFMAPELFEEDYDEKVDIYAFGMSILQLITKKPPYSECDAVGEVYRRVTSFIPPESLATVRNDHARAFIELGLLNSPNQRPSARELLEHTFLKEDKHEDCMEVLLGLRSNVDHSLHFAPSLASFASNDSNISRDSSNASINRMLDATRLSGATPHHPSFGLSKELTAAPVSALAAAFKPPHPDISLSDLAHSPSSISPTLLPSHASDTVEQPHPQQDDLQHAHAHHPSHEPYAHEQRAPSPHSADPCCPAHLQTPTLADQLAGTSLAFSSLSDMPRYSGPQHNPTRGSGYQGGSHRSCDWEHEGFDIEGRSGVPRRGEGGSMVVVSNASKLHLRFFSEPQVSYSELSDGESEMGSEGTGSGSGGSEEGHAGKEGGDAGDDDLTESTCRSRGRGISSANAVGSGGGMPAEIRSPRAASREEGVGEEDEDLLNDMPTAEGQCKRVRVRGGRGAQLLEDVETPRRSDSGANLAGVQENPASADPLSALTGICRSTSWTQSPLVNTLPPARPTTPKAAQERLASQPGAVTDIMGERSRSDDFDAEAKQIAAEADAPTSVNPRNSPILPSTEPISVRPMARSLSFDISVRSVTPSTSASSSSCPASPSHSPTHQSPTPPPEPPPSVPSLPPKETYTGHPPAPEALLGALEQVAKEQSSTEQRQSQSHSDSKPKGGDGRTRDTRPSYASVVSDGPSILSRHSSLRTTSERSSSKMTLIIRTPVKGIMREIEFEFYLLEDEPAAVAREMVMELEIPVQEESALAQQIAMLREEQLAKRHARREAKQQQQSAATLSKTPKAAAAASSVSPPCNTRPALPSSQSHQLPSTLPPQPPRCSANLRPTSELKQPSATTQQPPVAPQQPNCPQSARPTTSLALLPPRDNKNYQRANTTLPHHSSSVPFTPGPPPQPPSLLHAMSSCLSKTLKAEEDLQHLCLCDVDSDETLDEEDRMDAELQRLRQEYIKSVHRAQKAFKARMESMLKCKEDKEEGHRKLLEQHEKMMADFDRRLTVATDDQSKRLNDMKVQWQAMKVHYRQVVQARLAARQQQRATEAAVAAQMRNQTQPATSALGDSTRVQQAQSQPA